MNNHPSAMLIAGIPGGLALVGANYVGVDWVKMSLLVAGGILLLFAVAILATWLVDNAIQQYRDLMRARDRQIQLAEVIRNMQPYQIDYLAASTHIGIDRDLRGETFLRETEAPLPFVADYLSKCYTYSLKPIRDYSDGIEREWVQQITAVLIDAGYALEAIGNQAAQWIPGITPEIIAGKLGLSIVKHSPTGGGWTPIPGR
jgi:hypothetical protein